MSDLTIVMPSYNKEKYIAAALDSVFAQKTKYTYDIIIADDHSTDRTLEIVSQYEKSHPGIIKVLQSDRNNKLFRNVRRAYAILRTKYFCVLDPDDFWCDENKIQRSIDYLEHHLEYTVYATNTYVQTADGERRPYIGAHKSARDSDFEGFLYGRAIIGNSLGSMYRNVVFSKGLPEKLQGDLRTDQEASFRGDTFRTLIHLHEGKVHYEPICDAVYRVTEEGLWQGSSESHRMILNAYAYLNIGEYFNDKYYELFDKARRQLSNIMVNLYGLLKNEDSGDTMFSLIGQIRDLESRIRGKYASDVGIEKLPFRYTLYMRLYRWVSKKLLKHNLILG